MFGEFVPMVAIMPFLVPIVLIVCVTVLIAMRLGRGGMNKRDRAQWEEETRLMQEMHDDLAKMEDRIESLETILMGYPGKDKR